MDKLTILIKLYETLENTDFPDFTGNDSLDDWLADLVLVDSQLAGFAASAKTGGKVNKNDLPSLNNFEARLDQIFLSNTQVSLYVESYRSYLNLLLNLSSAIRVL